MKKINIVEMALRDGLQNEKKAVELAKRLALLDQLIRAGLSRIEIGAFVSPKWVPQMAVTKDFVDGKELRFIVDD
ncbi:MAG TPA: hydroxymethylglutaryl-CoA lyase, partial [Pseudobdellovibrionaceae bacterium]|nr:hydroxymethylglutaryl-CoA lyase [Pseudobdellovibrionaceae bacterium]